MRGLVNIYFWIFIFTTVNREFLLFGFDLRYALVTLAVILLVFYPSNNRHSVRKKKRESVSASIRQLFWFYAIIAISNISWLWNGLPLNDEQFLNIVILNINNLFALVVVVLYRSMLDIRQCLNAVILSGVVLVGSVIYVYSGFTIPEMFMSSDSRQYSIGAGFENLFGQAIRVSGFGEDANFTSLACILCFVCSLYKARGAILPIVFFGGLFFFGIALSFSRTMLLGMLVAVVATIAFLFLKRIWSIFSVVIVLTFAVTALLLLPNLALFGDMTTMDIRYSMWQSASELFLDNPVIGAGTSSVRSQLFLSRGIYGQCHSTWWQVVSEQGLIGIICFMLVWIKAFREARSGFLVLALVTTLVGSINFEIVYLQIFIFSLVICPILFDTQSDNIEVQELSNECVDVTASRNRERL